MTASASHAQNSTRHVVDAFFTAFGEGDREALLRLFADTVDFRVSGSPDVPWTGERSTKPEIEAFFGLFEKTLTAPESFALTSRVTEDEHCVVTAECVFGVLDTGKRFTNRYALHFTVSDGLIVRYHMYEDSYAIHRAFTA